MNDPHPPFVAETQSRLDHGTRPVGQFTFADITAFLAAFSAGCP